MIFTNAAAKRYFYLIRHFGVKMSPTQDIPSVKSVASSCPASYSVQYWPKHICSDLDLVEKKVEVAISH